MSFTHSCLRRFLRIRLVIVFACFLPAERIRVTLSVTVTDPYESNIFVAKLTLTSVETGNVFNSETNQSGQYRFLFLNPGRYRLANEMSGFRPYIREGIELSTNQAATIDLVLQLGTQAEAITVGAEAPLLE